MDAKSNDRRIADLKRIAAEYALTRDGGKRREATISTLRALWELAAPAGAPIEALAVVNKLIKALEELNRGETRALLQPGRESIADAKPAGASPDLALAAALVDALNEYERMPIQEAIDYVSAKRGLSAATLKAARLRLKSKTSTDPGRGHYQTALATIAAQSDPLRAIRTQLMK